MHTRRHNTAWFRLGLPVSTTHVSVGSLFGVGILSSKTDYGMIQKILLSWLFTLPTAAALAALVYLLAQ